jgi:hypothetical protein
MNTPKMRGSTLKKIIEVLCISQRIPAFFAQEDGLKRLSGIENILYSPLAVY